MPIYVVIGRKSLALYRALYRRFRENLYICAHYVRAFFFTDLDTEFAISIDFSPKNHQKTAIFEGFSLFFFRFRKPPIYSFAITYVRRRSIIECTSLRVCTAQPLLNVVRYTSLRLTNVYERVIVRTVRTAEFRKRKKNNEKSSIIAVF